MKYDFESKKANILSDAKADGVSVILVENGTDYGKLAFNGNPTAEQKKKLQARINTYNKNSTTITQTNEQNLIAVEANMKSHYGDLLAFAKGGIITPQGIDKGNQIAFALGDEYVTEFNDAVMTMTQHQNQTADEMVDELVNDIPSINKTADKIVDSALESEKEPTALLELAAQEKEEEVMIEETQVEEQNDEMEATALLTPPTKKLRKEKTQPETKTMEAAEEEAAFELMNMEVESDGFGYVYLSQLIALSDTPLLGGELAMREPNKQHVQHMVLALQEGDTFPPITVTGSNRGIIALNGYHRWMMYLQYLKEQVQKTDSENVAEDLQKAVSNFVIQVEVKNDMTEQAILDYAFSSNLKNGLPMNDNSRARYAVWLLDNAVNGLLPNGKKASARQAGLIARVSHVSVMNYIKQRSKKEGKMVDDYLPTKEEEDNEVLSDIAEKEAKKEHDPLAQASKSLVQAMSVLFEECSDPALMAVYLETVVTEKNIDKITTILTAFKLLAEKKQGIKNMQTEFLAERLNLQKAE